MCLLIVRTGDLVCCLGLFSWEREGEGQIDSVPHSGSAVMH